MSNDFSAAGDRPAHRGPARPHSEFFCIHSYAGESGPPCGWRGSAMATLPADAAGARRCPRCGRTTLLEIPLPPSGARA